VTVILDRHFLFLQGPHGPFFFQLAKMLRKAGAEVSRVGFTAGDRAFWFRGRNYIPFLGDHADWTEHLRTLLHEKQITDLVLYGDVRQIHAQAVEGAQELGLKVHIFEEGYLRPYWVTYERDGSNGYSKLMQMSVADMQESLAGSDLEMPKPPAHWGDMRQHMFYGALYHWFVLFRNRGYANYKRHRELPLMAETMLYTKHLMLMPYLALNRIVASRRIRSGGYPYHLVLMQLEHDASFQAHSKFDRMEDFIALVLEGFAQGAPQHHHLVFKAHPLESERVPLKRKIKDLASEIGVADRVHYVRGGKLAQILDQAKSAVTVNSTAGQQVLWRGIPLKVFGDAVYAKPEFVSEQSLQDFFANPTRPDSKAYRDYRRYLLETSQVPGGFYSTKGRRQLLRQVVDMMLADQDPYENLASGGVPPRQPLRVVQ